LYKKAREGNLPNLTGVGQDYEAPTSAELILDGTTDIALNVEKLMKEVLCCGSFLHSLDLLLN
ncbi:MAG: adenylyl-sulfate kinase, partial [Actinomycetota bacterium]